MSLGSGDWRAGIDDLDAALIDGYQSGLPVRERPFDAVAEKLQTDPSTVVRRIERLHTGGLLRRVGPVLNPPVIGSSTLAAMRVPQERFDRVAATVNEVPQVNHNYARDHEWNMWFVVTAATRETREQILANIGARTGLDVLNLPMRTDYYIDLEFPVVNRDRFARENLGANDVTSTRIDEGATVSLSRLDRRLLLAVQDGFPVTETPYRDLADDLSVPVTAVLDTVERLLESGCIKRIGCVVDHVATGFDSNCMVVWDVPDESLDDRGIAAGRLPFVTLCYHRPRRPAFDWPYNLFTMIHGREPAAVEGKIEELATDHLPFEHERLFSTSVLKQTGARYERLLDADD